LDARRSAKPLTEVAAVTTGGAPRGGNAKKTSASEITNIGRLQNLGFGGGRYEDQQDRIFWGTARIADAAADKKVLRSAYKEIDKATQHHVDGGSTLSAAILTPDHNLTLAQAGASPMILYLLNKKTGKVVVHDLTVNQRPDNADELKRIQAAGGVVEDGRQVNENSSLAVARGFGDHGFPGITAEPTIRTLNLKRILADPKTDAYLAIASDGMTEYTQPQDFAADIKPGDKPKDIADSFMGRALDDAKKSKVTEGDNISVAIVRLKPDDNVATYAGVADGHGEKAAEVAEAAKNGIHHVFHNYGAKPHRPHAPTEARQKPRK
jgi:serine/threonine protein phosphatase PrpC